MAQNLQSFLYNWWGEKSCKSRDVSCIANSGSTDDFMQKDLFNIVNIYYYKYLAYRSDLYNIDFNGKIYKGYIKDRLSNSVPFFFFFLIPKGLKTV